MLRSTVSLLRGSESHKRRPARHLSLEALEERILLDSQFPSIRVNDPTDDGKSLLDTHSETTLVLGANHTVVVAYNDSILDLANPPQGIGYSQSTDGGFSFVDKGALPANPQADFSDPV